MRKKWGPVLALVALLVAVSLACSLTSGIRSTPSPTPASVPSPTAAALPTPTAVAQRETPLPPVPPANALEAQVEGVYDRTGPSVVHITSRVISYDMFMQPVPQEGTGSGFVYDAQGHIVTNYHVVADAEAVLVSLGSSEVYTATIVGTDPSNDLAVLRIEAKQLPDPISLADSDQLRVGQFVVAIGNPFALDRTLTVGVISSLGRVIQSPDGRFIGQAIQTDAAINPGNSGGPLLDLEGRVVGVNSQIISPSQASAGIGFAVSANTVARVVSALITEGRYPHPSLGVSLLPFGPEGAKVLREAGMDVPVEQGLLVAEVTPGGPAATAGIRAGDRQVAVGNVRIPVGGDIIIAINGEPVTDFQTLNVYLEAQTQVGDRVKVTVVRDGQQTTVEVELGERPEQP
jgi:S1-C subfamily serine protease